MRGALVRLRGLVLNVSPYSEDSAVCSLATKDGIRPILANRVYRPKSFLKPLLVPGSIVVVDGMEGGKGLFLAKQCDCQYDSSPLLVDRRCHVFLLFLQDVSESLFRYGDSFPTDDVIQVLKGIYDGKDLLSLSLLFLGAIYKSLGIPMEVHSCVRCGKRETSTFSLGEGGLLCADCSRSIGAGAHTTMEAFVFKYAFLPPTERNLSRVVPLTEGLGVLSLLCGHLCGYFDLSPLRTLSLLRKECSNRPT